MTKNERKVNDFVRLYNQMMNMSPEVQDGIKDMIQILKESHDCQEREMAFNTLLEIFCSRGYSHH